ncbi:MAG: sulfotransferase [Pirellulales bacterium]|nr:sulfotransferase [Planctomycetales bacterium]
MTATDTTDKQQTAASTADSVQFTCEVGAARSGTNFLGELLSQHPDLAYWRRPKYVWRHGNAWKSDDCLTADDARPRVKQYIRRRFTEKAQEEGKQHLLVCTQANSLALGFVDAVFPDGKIIHIIRDGREVASSQAKEWEIHSSITKSKGSRPPFFTLLRQRIGEVPPSDLPAYFGEFAGTVWTMLAGSKYRYSMGPKIHDWRKRKAEMGRLEYTALTWRECVAAAREVGRRLPANRYLEVRFEDVVARPEETVPRLLEFLGLPPAKEVDEFIAKRIDRSTVGKWLDRISDEEMARIMPYVGDLCRDLGYIDT